MDTPKLNLELLNGPLDGLIITLETDTAWSHLGDGSLSFPWDAELGTPQARFFFEGESWWLESHNSPHGTYCLNREERVEGKSKVEPGDILKASATWLRVKQVG